MAFVKEQLSLAAEAERMKFGDQILYAEQQLAAAKGREEALQDQLLKEVNESHERLKKQIHIHSELEVSHLTIYLFFKSFCFSLDQDY